MIVGGAGTLIKKGVWDHAYQMAVAFNKNPKDWSQITGLLRVDNTNPQIDLNYAPEGTYIVWGKGACGFSAKSGHAEIVVKSGDHRNVCSDFCEPVESRLKKCGETKPLGVYIPARDACVGRSPKTPQDTLLSIKN
jgi:hypothetical protein